MNFKYYIISDANDFYLADALGHEFEKRGEPFFLNVRDIMGASTDSGIINNVAGLIAILSKNMMSGDVAFTSIIETALNNPEVVVYLLKSESDVLIPDHWQNYRLIDAYDGLTRSIIDNIAVDAVRSERELLPKTYIEGETVTPCFQAENSTESNVREIYCRHEKPSIQDLISDEKVHSPILQRAMRYLKGDGIPQDDERAFSLFKKAASENPEDPEAQYLLGVCSELEFGGGRFEDAKQAYENAIHLGKKEATFRLGMVCYVENPKGNQEARPLFAKALEMNDSMGAYGLGLLDEAAGNYDDAVERYFDAAEMGNPLAQNALGCLYCEGKGVKPNEHKAMQWFEIAAKNGLPEAMVNYGILLLKSPNEEEKGLGETMLRAAAERGNHQAQYQVQKIDAEKEAAQRRMEAEHKRQERERHDDNNDNSTFGDIVKGINWGELGREIGSYAKGRLWG